MPAHVLHWRSHAVAQQMPIVSLAFALKHALVSQSVSLAHGVARFAGIEQSALVQPGSHTHVLGAAVHQP